MTEGVLGTIITTEDSPSVSKFAFVIDEKGSGVNRGQFVSCECKDGVLVGLVTNIYKTNKYFESAGAVSEYSKSTDLFSSFPVGEWEYSICEVRVLGVFTKTEGVQRVNFPPKPGSNVVEVPLELLNKFLGLDQEKGLHLGKVSSHNLDAKFNMTKLLQKHLAILSISGGGKSYAASVLIEELLDRDKKFGQIGVLLVDNHSEYLGFLGDSKYMNKVKVIDGRGVRIACKNLHFQMIHSLLPNISGVQARELGRVIEVLRKEGAEEGRAFDLDDMINRLREDEKLENNKKTREALISWVLELKHLGVFDKIENPKIRDVLKAGELTIIDLGNITSLRKKQLIVDYFSRELFELRRRGLVCPYLEIIEEAHNFCPEGKRAEQAISRYIIETVAREGRKFFANLCLISQRPIHLSTTALSQCVAPDTLVTLNPEQPRSIKDLEDFWQEKKVLTYDTENGQLVRAPITGYIKYNPKDTSKMTFQIRTDSGRVIVATEDHPFWQGSWTALRELKEGDRVAIMPQQAYFDEKLNSDVLIEESSMMFLPSTINKKRLFERLRSLGLLPLTLSNSKTVVLTRLLGHLFGDGTLHPPYKNKEGHYSLKVTYTGNCEDLALIKKDLEVLGFSGNEKISTQYRSSEANFINYGRHKISGTSTYFKTGIVALWAILRALGAPVGDKSSTKAKIPEWIMNAPKNIKREFLAALMGSEASKIRMGRWSAERLYLPFSKVERLESNGEKYAQQIMKLLSDLGVRSTSFRRSYALRKDGQKTIQFVIAIQRARKNILAFCRKVGYRYSKTREIQARYVQTYFEYLEHQIGKRFLTTKAKRLLNIRPAYKNTLDFKTWTAQRTNGLKEGLVWEIIESKEKCKIDDVRDITVPGYHSFFANGFLTHNCNTHIILRITNPYDLKHISETSEHITSDIINIISSLRVGEAIVLGEASGYPVFIKIRKRRSKEKEINSLEDAAREWELRNNKLADAGEFL